MKYIRTEKARLKALEKIRKQLIKTKKPLSHLPFHKQTANDWLSDLHKQGKTRSDKVEAYISHLRVLSRINEVNNRKYNVLYFNVCYTDLPKSGPDICAQYGVEETPSARCIISRIKRKLIAVS